MSNNTNDADTKYVSASIMYAHVVPSEVLMPPPRAAPKNATQDHVVLANVPIASSSATLSPPSYHSLATESLPLYLMLYDIPAVVSNFFDGRRFGMRAERAGSNTAPNYSP